MKVKELFEEEEKKIKTPQIGGRAYLALKGIAGKGKMSTQEIYKAANHPGYGAAYGDGLWGLLSNGWIKRIERGVYEVTAEGKEALKRADEKGRKSSWGDAPERKGGQWEHPFK